VFALVVIFEAVHFIHMKLLIEQTFPHRFAFNKKRWTNFEYFENIRSSNVVEYECELRPIPSAMSLSVRSRGFLRNALYKLTIIIIIC